MIRVKNKPHLYTDEDGCWVMDDMENNDTMWYAKELKNLIRDYIEDQNNQYRNRTFQIL